jgi:pimeloyl-ACP methyl ester carboxylesterase
VFDHDRMTTNTITRPDARQVAFEVVGPSDGPPVLLCHAAPGSRAFDPDPTSTAAAGVRLVTIDRPGSGGSDPLADGVVPTIPQFAADAAAVLDGLGITDAVVAGWSAGGRVAAALAAARPDLVGTLFVIATPAPDEEVPWVPDEQRAAIQVMKADPPAAVGQMAGMLAGMLEEGADATALVAAGAADARVLAADDDLRARLDTMLGESLRQGPTGLAAEIVSYTVAEWGFDPASVGAPTTCVYGGADDVVPPAHGEWWASRIPEARVEVVEGAGHLVVVPAWAGVLSAARR